MKYDTYIGKQISKQACQSIANILLDNLAAWTGVSEGLKVRVCTNVQNVFGSKYRYYTAYPSEYPGYNFGQTYAWFDTAADAEKFMWHFVQDISQSEDPCKWLSKNNVAVQFEEAAYAYIPDEVRSPSFKEN